MLSLLSIIPGFNYVLLVWNFVVKYWKPIALAAALAFSYFAGVKHEAKKNRNAQLTAQLRKVTFERDNLANAALSANMKLQDLDSELEKTRKQVDDLLSKPVTGDCVLSEPLRKRLRNIGR